MKLSFFKVGKKHRSSLLGTLAVFGLTTFVFFSAYLNLNNQASIPAASRQPISHGVAGHNAISLIIPVQRQGESALAEYNQKLDILKQRGYHANFFINGFFASTNNPLLLRMRDEGHELGNMGFFHRDHRKLDERENRQEIGITHKLIETITGVNMNLFLPPNNHYNTKTIEIAEELGYKTIIANNRKQAGGFIKISNITELNSALDSSFSILTITQNSAILNA